jgi:hypothetical protein
MHPPLTGLSRTRLYYAPIDMAILQNVFHRISCARILSGSPNSSWLARGQIASGAGLSARRNLRSGMKP